MELSPDPSLKELQLLWERQYWFRSKSSFRWYAKWYNQFMFFFGAERKPRDIFRNDITEWKVYLKKKGLSDNTIGVYFGIGKQFYKLLNEYELVEHNFDPFEGMAPRRIRKRAPR